MTETPATLACLCTPLIERARPVENPLVFGLDAQERLRRSYSTCDLRIIESDDLANVGDERVIALCTSHFYEHRLIVALSEHAGDLLLLAEGAESGPVCVGLIGSASRIGPLIPALRTGDCVPEAARAAGLEILSPADVVPAHNPKLRKNTPPFVLPADPHRTREIEDQIFDASYKGVTDFVTKWVWPAPARIVTGWCARLGIAPNTVTALSYAFTLFSLLAFWQGDFALGLVSAWIMTFLDTVDGKLARVTLTMSKLGDVLDHGLDLIHPPFWWAAWGAGLAGPGLLFGDYQVWVAIAFFGYILGRLLEGLFMVVFDQEMFTWRPFDFGFRLFIARRNPNLVLLTFATILGRPDLGFIAVGVWTLSCCAIQCVRIGQAMILRLRGQEISPYSG